jgi:hypothetical protein
MNVFAMLNTDTEQSQKVVTEMVNERFCHAEHKY